MFTIWNVTFLKNELFMIYQRFKKGGRVSKSQFLAKSVQKSLNKKNKNALFSKKYLFWIANYSETVHFWAYTM